MADEDTLLNAAVAVEHAVHDVLMMDDEEDWAKLIKAAEDILKIAGAR